MVHRAVSKNYLHTIKIFWTACVLICSMDLYASRGLPYLQFYNQKVYQGFNGVWGSIQGENGIMYFGYGNGILEYDGVTWRKLYLPNLGHVRTFCKNREGKIFVGGLSDFGFLQSDSLGAMIYHSLVGELDSLDQAFIEVWKTFAIQDSVFFVTEQSVIRYHQDAFEVWHAPNRILSSHVVSGRLIFEVKNIGMMALQDDQIVLDDREWPGNSTMMDLVNWNGKWIYARNNGGLFIQSGSSYVPYKHEAISYVEKHRIYRLCVLENDWLCIGTRSGGLVVLDEFGKIEYLIRNEHGLGDDFVSSLYQDLHGGLWVTNLEGLARVEIPTPFKIFDERNLPFQNIEAITEYQDQIYAGGVGGLLAYDGQQFREIRGPKFVYDLTPVEDVLIIASSDGVFSLDQMNLNKLLVTEAHSLLYDPFYPNILFVGLYNGLAYLERTTGSWKFGGIIDEIKDDIRTMEVSDDGTLWLEPQSGGIYKITNPLREVGPVQVDFFQCGTDLPAGNVFLKTINRRPILNINNNQVWAFSVSRDSFVPYEDFQNLFASAANIIPSHEDKYGNLCAYVNQGGKLQRAIGRPNDENLYDLFLLNDLRITHLVGREFYPLRDGIIWYGGPDGLIRHDPSVKGKATNTFSCLVRQVSLNRDSILFHGHEGTHTSPILPYAHNALRFSYTSTSYTLPEKTEYRVKLEGFDQDWSEWTLETQRDYTNIPEGSYEFKVHARNIYGISGDMGTYRFEILPPWHRTYWAYLLYLIGLSGFIIALVHLRSRGLARDKENLQKLVEAKTREIQDQAEQLKELDQLKSRFFQNISHEFRTPLTLIKTPLGAHLKRNTIPDRDELEMMHFNSNRLNRLIDQILELSRIDIGGMKLHLVKGDIARLLKSVTSSFDSLAANKDIAFEIDVEPDSFIGIFDVDKYEKIVTNLLYNAFKFTDPGGQVFFQATFDHDFLYMQVSDSGQGIAPDEIEKIFDRFYRTRQSTSKEQEGTGIGLALTNELIRLLQGQIQVKSTLGKGSTFSITLPVRETHFSNNPPVEIQDFMPHQQDVEFDAETTLIGDERPLILIVEDHQDLRKYISKILIDQYSVKHASNGHEGLIKAQKLIPDLIITDVMMPESDGLEMSAHLKNDPKTNHIPIVVLTAKVEVEDKLAGLKTGVDDYLSKPFNAEELLTRVHNLIDQRKLLQEHYSQSLILKPNDVPIDSMDARFLKEAIKVIESNLDNSEFSIEDFAHAMNLSRMQLHRKLKALTGQSATRFIRSLRLNRAAQLLQENAGTVSEICYQVGFNNLSYFTKTFREKFEKLPSEYLKV